MNPLNAEHVREIAGEPPRFLSLGTVEDEAPVTFDAELKYPLVNVALQPSRISVRCRNLMRAGGKGEGDWYPFVAGDEVLVAMPSGPRGECLILGRAPSTADPFPTSVAGQDATKNALSFTRRACAHFEESKGPWTTMTQPSGAFVNLSAEGNVTLRDGSKGALQLSADALSYVSGDGKNLLQIDLGSPRFVLRVDKAMLVLQSSGASAILAPGALSLSAAGQPAHEHAISTEAVCGLLVQLLTALGTANPGPILGAALLGAAQTVVAAAVTLAASPIGALQPPVAGAIQAAFAIALQKPAGVPGIGQLTPGIGSAGIMIG